jgi:hypothetical protein
MLPMISAQKRNLIAGVTALSVVLAGATPALAWGKKEQGILTGIAAVILFQQLVKHSNAAPAPRPQPLPLPPRPQEPVRYQPVSIYATPVGQAFNAYTDSEQRRIQSTLSAYGYYQGTIDGSFGPGTYNALALYASRTGKVALMDNRSGAFSLLDGLLF